MNFLMDLFEKLFRKPLPNLTAQAQIYFPDDNPREIVAIVDQYFAGLTNQRTQQEIKLALIEKYAGDKEMLQKMVNSLKLDYRDALVWLQRFKSSKR
ncbi:MAG: hypothetical protein Kow0031_35470 [Anaerolineae bacterium]